MLETMILGPFLGLFGLVATVALWAVDLVLWTVTHPVKAFYAFVLWSAGAVRLLSGVALIGLVVAWFFGLRFDWWIYVAAVVGSVVYAALQEVVVGPWAEKHLAARSFEFLRRRNQKTLSSRP